MQKNLLNLFILLTFIVHVKAENLYVWTDNHGNKVYADKIPQKVQHTNNYKIVTKKEVSTVEWNSTPPLSIKTIKTKKQKSNSKIKKEICRQLKIKINKTTHQFKKRLKTDKFDQTKMNLATYRREYRKKCV